MKRDFILFLCLAVSISNLIIHLVQLTGKDNGLGDVLFTSQSFSLPVVHHVSAPAADANSNSDEDVGDEHLFIHTKKTSIAVEETLDSSVSGLRGSNQGKAKIDGQGIKKFVLSESESMKNQATDSTSIKMIGYNNKKDERRAISSISNIDGTNKVESKKKDINNKYSIFPPNVHFSTEATPSRSRTANTYISTNKQYVLKSLKQEFLNKMEWLDREICMLKYLNEDKGGFDWAPKLVWYNESAMLTSYVGVPLDVFNMPLDYREQYKQILSDMKSIGVEHGDIYKFFGHPNEWYNLMVQDEGSKKQPRLSLVNFGSAKLNGSFTCNGQVSSNISDKRKQKINPDLAVMDKLDATFERHLKVEQHFMVDWTQHYPEEEIRKTIKDKWPNLVIRKMVTHPAYTNDTERKAVFTEFYRHPIDGFRGKTPFNIYFIYDMDPKYDVLQTTKGQNIVNTALLTLKHSLRKGMGGGYKIHATDNIQETKDNMLALKWPKEYRQRRFDTLRQVFDVLNVSEMPYVVLRNYEQMPDSVQVDPTHLDVDILVSDYYEAKRILDGDSPDGIFKDHYENGKHRIRNMVFIEGHKVKFDIRSVGDGYYDEKWQREMLARRVTFNGIQVASKEDHLYSLIYHAIIQKPQISETYVKLFMKKAKYTEEQARNKVFLRQKLDAYMKEHGYEMVKPRDVTVGYHIWAGNQRRLETQTNTNVESSSFCNEKGSLHQIGLDLINYSSPPGSPSYNKLLHVLDASSQFYIRPPRGRKLFTKTSEAAAQMLTGYGLKETKDPSSQNVLLVDRFSPKVSSPCPIETLECRNQPRIIIQSEQFQALAFRKQIIHDLRFCNDSPNCIIWEFSEYIHSKLKESGLGNSTVLMPMMIQSPSRLAKYEPLFPKDVKDRSHDIVFFGKPTTRRKELLEQSKSYLEKHTDRSIIFNETLDLSIMSNAYKDAKVCLVAHSEYGKSGGEYHRLSEFGPFGCIPVLEEFSDKISIDSYRKCGGAVFTTFNNLLEAAEDVITRIDQGLYSSSSVSISNWWKAGIQWETVLKSIFPLGQSLPK